MAVSREEIIEALKEMSLLEASELVKDIELLLLLLLLLAAKLLLRSLSSTLYSKASATTRSLLSRLYVRSPVSA